jgi:hypothetical protein
LGSIPAWDDKELPMSVASIDQNLYSALEETIGVLRGVADFRLEGSTVDRMRELGESKEACSAEERAEHRQLTELWQRRTLQKLQALNALKRLREIVPELVGDLPEIAMER